MPGVAMMRTASYDAENRMISEMDANGTTATYAYDENGHRVTKTWNGVTRTFVYHPEGHLAQGYSWPTIPLPKRARGCRLRPGECFRLRKENVLEGLTEIHFGKGKNARRRIPMTLRVKGSLDMRLSKADNTAWAFLLKRRADILSRCP
jgi:YD repeat-containing protein